jgi:TrmH family RNA methyltransferase
MVRSAEAFGATGLVFLSGSAHVSNGKLLRAAAGSMFRMPSLEGVTAGDLLSHTDGLKVYALDSAGAVPLPEARLDEPCILIAGNEGSGVRPELLPKATRISIPTRKVESLNAAVACSLALYTAWQQRTTS